MKQEDDARQAILRRRRKFVAVALAGAGMTVGVEACKPPPQPCLDVAPVEVEPTEPSASASSATPAPEVHPTTQPPVDPPEPTPPAPSGTAEPRACLDFAATSE